MNVFSNVSNSFNHQIRWQSELTRNVARNVVNGQNDNNDTPQQGENLATVHYEHIVGHLITNPNMRLQPIEDGLPAERPGNQPAAQPGEDGLPVLRRANQPAAQPGEDGLPVLRRANQPAAQPGEDGLPVLRRANQQENQPASNIIYYDGRQKLVRRSNDAEIALYGNGKHHRTGSIDVTSGYGAEVRAYYADYSSYINMQNGGRIHRSNSITVEPGTKAEMTSSDGSTQTSIEFENKTRIHKDGSFDF